VGLEAVKSSSPERVVKDHSSAPEWWLAIRAHRTVMLGLIILVIAILVALIGPFVVEGDPLKTNLKENRTPPNAQYLFGTDEVGRDIFVRVIYAIRLDLILVIMIAGIATVLGAGLGLLSGYVGGTLDQVLMRITDIMMAFPGFLLAIAVTAVLGNNIRTVVLALGIAYAPVAIRLVRAQVLTMRDSQFVEASRAIGTPGWQIMTNHLFPLTLSILLAQASLFLAWSVLDVAGLSFLGLGIRPPTPELGSMTAEGAEFIVTGEWWISVFPGLAIMLLALAFTLLGDGLRDIFDPRHKG
jgi:peptide/nickel transport system permease protein